MIHVADVVTPPFENDKRLYLKRKVILETDKSVFLKHYTINADSQMKSIKNNGVSVEYVYLTNRKSIISLFKAGMRIRNICIKKDIHILHAFWGTTTGLISVVFSPCPVIISFCGSDLIGTKNSAGHLTLGGVFNKLVSNIISRLTTANITKSEQMKSMLPKSAQQRTTVIPNGVDIKKFYIMDIRIAKKKLGLLDSIDYILFFFTEGQDVKNSKMAMQVFNLVKDSRPKTEIIVATNIVHEDLVYYYNASSVMILTSFHEGSNNSVKEAIACNLPIVSVNVGDTKERLNNKKNCHIINSYDPILFTKKVLNVLNSGERSDGAKNISEISISSAANNIIKIYKKVHNNKNN